MEGIKLDKKTKVLLVITLFIGIIWVTSFFMSSGDDLYDQDYNEIYATPSIEVSKDMNNSDNTINQLVDYNSNKIIDIVFIIVSIIMGITVLSVFFRPFRNIGMF